MSNENQKSIETAKGSELPTPICSEHIFETHRFDHAKEIVEYIIRGPGRKVVPRRIYEAAHAAAWEIQDALDRNQNAEVKHER